MIRAQKTLYEKKPLDTHSTASLPPLSILEKNQLVFQKTHLLLQKNQNFERFQNSYCSSHILRQICYSLVEHIFTVRREQKGRS